jgi:osmotically-inducible protein OsmY
MTLGADNAKERHMQRWLRVVGFGMALLATGLQACAPAAVGAGATAGTTAMQERGLSGALTDTQIRTQINHLWFQESERMYRYVNLQVQNRRVLLTGVVPEQAMRTTAAELAWQVDDVREVINEVKVVDNRNDVAAYAEDSWIAAQLKTKLLFDTEIASINYSIEVVRGVIYLIGIARSEAELERALDHARNLADVKEVVSYVEVQPPASDGDGNGGTMQEANAA